LFNDIEGFLIDLDGTIMNGKELILGAEKAISFLQNQNKRLVFLSNRGNISRKTCFERLLAYGIKVEEENIILASTVTAKFLKKYYPFSKVWTLGNKGLEEELLTHGVIIASAPEEADFLVITLHDDITYPDLNMAFKAVRHGARIIATNADKTYPLESGSAIDVAGMIGAIESATGKKTEVVIGKPSCFMIEAALEQLQLKAEQCMVIGDSLESDIAMGKLHGMKTSLVLTGNTSRNQLEGIVNRHKPDYVIDSIYDIVNK
jgi:arabinose operon protein AraL